MNSFISRAISVCCYVTTKLKRYLKLFYGASRATILGSHLTVVQKQSLLSKNLKFIQLVGGAKKSRQRSKFD